MKDVQKRFCALAVGGSAVLAMPAAASAQLGLPLPDPGATVQSTTSTLGSVPVVGGALTDATGTVGGIVGSLDGSVTGTVDQVIGGILAGGGATGTTTGGGTAPATGSGTTGGQLPGSTIDSLLQVFGTVATGDGGVVVDTTAPTPAVKVLSRLRQIQKTGSLRIQVSSDEAGIVAVGGAVRPGTPLRKAYAKGHNRRLVKWPAAVLAFRSPGTLQVTVKLSRAAKVNLGRSKDARIGVATLAADLRKNQRWGYVKRHMPR